MCMYVCCVCLYVYVCWCVLRLYCKCRANAPRSRQTSYPKRTKRVSNSSVRVLPSSLLLSLTSLTGEYYGSSYISTGTDYFLFIFDFEKLFLLYSKYIDVIIMSVVLCNLAEICCIWIDSYVDVTLSRL